MPDLLKHLAFLMLLAAVFTCGYELVLWVVRGGPPEWRGPSGTRYRRRLWRLERWSSSKGRWVVVPPHMRIPYEDGGGRARDYRRRR